MQGTSVLVVEDEHDTAQLLSRHLASFCDEVAVADNGHEGLRLAAERRWGLIILDIGLPGLNGLEVCRRIRAGECHTPVLMLSARNSDFDRVLGLDIGADDYVAKPFKFPVLLARAHGLVAAYSAHVSSYGPVPGTLAGEAGAVSLLHVAFVDADALACLNASEALGKNYALALVSGHRLDFGGGLGLDAGLAYISMRGVHAPSGAPLRLTAFRAEGSRLSARSQREILDGLRRHLASRAPLEDFVAEQVGDEAVRLARRWNRDALGGGRALSGCWFDRRGQRVPLRGEREG